MLRRALTPAVRIAAAVSVGAFLGCTFKVVAATPASRLESPVYSIRWNPDLTISNKFVVEVSGLGAATLQPLQQTNWTRTQWQRLLSVYAEQGNLITDVGLPPMSGEYRATSTQILFEPRFPLQPGTKYRAVFSPERLPGKPAAIRLLNSVFQIPHSPASPTTVIANVFPSANVLPENLLKFYIHFSAPMSRGHIYDHIRLRDETGKDVDLPFLEIDEELWNPDMTRLTLFIDPGRIKRGVQPLEEVGPALEEGKQYTLLIDAAWTDAANLPLKQGFQKRFKVGPTDRRPISAAEWKIHTPKAATREPLAITFAEPMDHALSLRVIRVMDTANQMIEGNAALENQERRWIFTPAQAWPRGAHTLSVQTTIEDLAGNNIGKSFEVDLFEGVQRRFTNATVKLPFTVQ